MFAPHMSGVNNTNANPTRRRLRGTVKQEPAVVPLPYARVDEETVVVEGSHAAVADFTVVGAEGWGHGTDGATLPEVTLVRAPQLRAPVPSKTPF